MYKYTDLHGSFSGFTKEYVISSKRHRMFMKELHSFFFTVELLYSFNI